MPKAENVCMKVDTFRSACVTKVGWTGNKSARNHRRQLGHLKRDCANCMMLIIFATLNGSKVTNTSMLKVAVDGPGPAMMGEGYGASCGAAYDGHLSSRK